MPASPNIKSFFLKLVLCASFVISTTHAAITWTPMNGPGGGQITSFEFLSDTEIWASSQVGLIYKTTDGGASWNTVSSLEGMSSVNNALNLSIDSAGKYYAHLGDKLFSSIDSGATWLLLSSDINSFYVDANDVLYKSDVGLDMSVFQYVAKVSSSSDGGNSWTELGELARNVTKAATVITQDAAGNFYALIQNTDVYRSTDAGVTWTAIAELTSLPVSLASDDQGNVFASADGLYVSTDNGSSWTEKTTVTHSIDHFSFSDTGIVYAKDTGNSAYWHSSDSGATWSSTMLSQSDTLINHLDSAPNGDLYINSYPRYDRGALYDMPNPAAGRVMKLPISGGSSFIDLNTGLGHVSISHIVESGSNLIASASYGNLWLSTDSGSTWSIPSTVPEVGIYGLGVQGGNVFAMSSSGIYSSSDNGVTWSLINADTGHYSEFASDANGRLYIYGEGGFHFSDDTGVNWVTANTGCAGSPVDDENALAVSSDGQNIFVGECYSNDAGSNWSSSIFPGSSTHVIHSLVLNASGDVFAGKNLGGIEKSTDNGANYVLSNGGMDTFGNNPAGISTLFRDSAGSFYALAPYGVGAYLSGVWSSADDGANWVRDNAGLPVVATNGEFAALAITETATGNLILSTGGTGFYISSTSGGSADTTAPVVTAPGDINVTAESVSGTVASNSTIAAFLAGASAIDDVDGNVTVTDNAPATFPAGVTTTVTFSATDAAGNTGTATAEVSVGTFNASGSDTTPPIVTALANITVAAESESGTAASNTSITTFLDGSSADDAVDGSVNVTNDAPATFPAGIATTVTFSATDAAGNTGTATATVTVEVFDNGTGDTASDSSSGSSGAFNLITVFMLIVMMLIRYQCKSTRLKN